MNKKIAGVFLVGIILLLTGCTRGSYLMFQHIESSFQLEATKMESKMDTGIVDVHQAYLSVLRNETELFNKDRFVYMNEYLEKTYEIFLISDANFAILDMDGDDIQELILEVVSDTRVILHYENGVMYGYSYKDGNVVCDYSDTTELNGFSLPLRDGRFLGAYSTGGIGSVDIYKLTLDYAGITEKSYSYNTNAPDEYFYLRDYSKEEPYGEGAEITKDQWLQFLEELKDLCFKDKEWDYCSDLDF